MKLDDHLISTLAQIPLELEKVRTELTTGLAESHNGVRLTGARYVSLGRPLVWGGTGRLVGWSIRSTGGSSNLTLHNSRDNSGEVIAVITLAAEAGETIWFGSSGVTFTEGLYISGAGAGVLEGAIWLGAVD